VAFVSVHRIVGLGKVTKPRSALTTPLVGRRRLGRQRSEHAPVDEPAGWLRRTSARRHDTHNRHQQTWTVPDSSGLWLHFGNHDPQLH
jgi:hypothetical protein